VSGTSCNFDAYNCQYHGWTSAGARAAVRAGHDAISKYAVKICEKKAQQGYALENITSMQANSNYEAAMDYMAEHGGPAPDYMYSFMAAWMCANGGDNLGKGAKSNGPIADVAYCAYSWGDMNPTRPGEFCYLDECDGFDPVLGQNVADYHTSTGPVALSREFLNRKHQ